MMLTEATSTPWLCAMWPRIEKVTVPASKHVAVFTRHVITVSLVEIRSVDNTWWFHSLDTVVVELVVAAQGRQSPRPD